jgi:hypothetical protein
VQALRTDERAPSIVQLESEVRYHRERYDLYQAKMYGQRPTTMARLLELGRAYQTAEARLRRAKQAPSRV